MNSEKFKKLLKLTRPFVLGHTIIISLMYCLIAGFNFVKSILVMFSLVSIHAFAQMTNLIYDSKKQDKINKPWRPLVTGEVKYKHAMILNIFFLVLAFTLAYLVNNFFFKMMFVLMFFALTFTISPVRKNQFTHILWMAITRGFLPTFMVTKNIFISTLFFVWNLAFNVVKDVPDAKGDRIFGIKTIYNVYGERGLKIWCYTFGSLFYVLIIIFVLTNILPIYSLSMFITLPLLYAIPESIYEKPAFSDNNLAYDLYWFGFSLNSIFLALSLLYV